MTRWVLVDSRTGRVVYDSDADSTSRPPATPRELRDDWARVQERWRYIVYLMRHRLRETAHGKVVPDERR